MSSVPVFVTIYALISRIASLEFPRDCGARSATSKVVCSTCPQELVSCPCGKSYIQAAGQSFHIFNCLFRSTQGSESMGLVDISNGQGSVDILNSEFECCNTVEPAKNEISALVEKNSTVGHFGNFVNQKFSNSPAASLKNNSLFAYSLFCDIKTASGESAPTQINDVASASEFCDAICCSSEKISKNMLTQPISPVADSSSTVCSQNMNGFSVDAIIQVILQHLNIHIQVSHCWVDQEHVFGVRSNDASSGRTIAPRFPTNDGAYSILSKELLPEDGVNRSEILTLYGLDILNLTVLSTRAVRRALKYVYMVDTIGVVMSHSLILCETVNGYYFIDYSYDNMVHVTKCIDKLENNENFIFNNTEFIIDDPIKQVPHSNISILGIAEIMADKMRGRNFNSFYHNCHHAVFLTMKELGFGGSDPFHMKYGFYLTSLFDCFAIAWSLIKLSLRFICNILGTIVLSIIHIVS